MITLAIVWSNDWTESRIHRHLGFVAGLNFCRWRFSWRGCKSRINICGAGQDLFMRTVSHGVLWKPWAFLIAHIFITWSFLSGLFPCCRGMLSLNKRCHWLGGTLILKMGLLDVFNVFMWHWYYWWGAFLICDLWMNYQCQSWVWKGHLLCFRSHSST